MKKKNIINNSSMRLAVLSAAHFMADMLGGTLPGILPVALVYFNLNLGWGVVILTSMSIGCNIMQIPAARLDRRSRSPRMLICGLAMAGALVLLSLMPQNTPFVLICLLMLIVGVGIAIVHPLGLRGMQNIRDIAPGISTPAFMTCGFLGSAVGPWLSAVLISSRFGMKGLFWLIIPLALVIVMIKLSHVKLALDCSAKTGNVQPESGERPVWSFKTLLLTGFLMNTGTALLQNFLPLRLVELNLSLSFGGMSAMLFGAGSAAGSMAMGVMVTKYPVRRMIPGVFMLGIPVLIAYLFFAHYRLAGVLILLAGALCSSAFPILVSMARSSESRLALSTRMALIVGGTWGCAGIMLLFFGQLAQRIGLASVMHCSWVFYILALTALLLPLRRK